MKKIDMMKERLKKNREKWMKKYEATDITIGLKEVDGKITDELCYKFWVDKKVSTKRLTKSKVVPQELSREFTDVKEEEEYIAYNEGTKRLRPIKMGGSIGNIKGGTGTSGLLYKKDGEYFILSNAHVLSADPFKYISDQEVKNVQPGRYHGGKHPVDYCGDMRYMILLNNQSKGEFKYSEEDLGMHTDGTYIQASYNTADAALLKPNVEVVRDIINLPNAPKVAECIVEPGDYVVYSTWQQNGVTKGIVTDVGKSSMVGYDGKKALLRDLIVVTKMSGSGSSGSGAIRERDKAVMGLNFAGSNTLNLICAIQHINTAFDGEVVVSEGEAPSKDIIVDFIVEKEGSNTGKRTVRGTVKDEDYTPVEGAQMSIESRDGEFGSGVSTNGEGKYAFFNLESKVYDLTFSKEGYITQEKVVDIPNNTIYKMPTNEGIQTTTVRQLFSGVGWILWIMAALTLSKENPNYVVGVAEFVVGAISNVISFRT